MVHGIEIFKEKLGSFRGQYVLIGGTACDLHNDDAGLQFRSTKDIDMVLILEGMTREFLEAFFAFIRDGKYQNRCRSDNRPQFYRFSHPEHQEYPYMIELFSRSAEALPASPDKELGHLAHIPLDEELSSLSAILLNDDYYRLIRSGITDVEGLSTLAIPQLILLKAKAWLDNKKRREEGQQVHSEDITKHKKDVFRLIALLNENDCVEVPASVYKDFTSFIEAMKKEEISPTLRGKTPQEELLNRLVMICTPEQPADIADTSPEE